MLAIHVFPLLLSHQIYIGSSGVQALTGKGRGVNFKDVAAGLWASNGVVVSGNTIKVATSEEAEVGFYITFTEPVTSMEYIVSATHQSGQENMEVYVDNQSVKKDTLLPGHLESRRVTFAQIEPGQYVVKFKFYGASPGEHTYTVSNIIFSNGD